MKHLPGKPLQTHLAGPFLFVGLTSLALGLLLPEFSERTWRLLAVLVVVLVVGGGAWLAAFFSARLITTPLQTLRRRADALFEHRSDNLAASDIHEVAALGQAVRRMLRQLDERVLEADERRKELEIVLNSMVEGFVAVNENETVFKVNAAACQILEIEPTDIFGRDIREFIRTPEFHLFVERVLSTGEVATISLSVRTLGGTERELDISASAIIADDGVGIGALFVIDDVTQLRQLETMRRDFVANVSHELKTPITSIKGFTETLLDGALEEPEHARRFLEIIARQSDRLNEIIEDLLSLARIERMEEAQESISIDPIQVHELLEAVVQTSDGLAQQRGTTVEIDCALELTVSGEASLLEQAVSNLLNNAIKYSPENSHVMLRARADERMLSIHVEDSGPGIPVVHVPRLFERFYRIDNSRGREVGGTGLGLAIVKHIAQLHRGDVKVRSEVGKGSIFTIVLPQAFIDEP